MRKRTYSDKGENIMNKYAALVMVFLFSSPVLASGIGTFNSYLAESSCADEWTKRGELNSRMFKYCMTKQTDGYADAMALSLKHGASGSKPVKSFGRVIQFAMEKWAKPRKYDMNMVAFELKQQVEGFLDTEWAVSQGKVNSGELNRCKDKWLPQWSMVAFCLEK
jgi:hypothetical protein